MVSGFKTFGEGDSMAEINSLIGSLLTIYNNSGSLVDPVVNRNGSFFFGPAQEISFRNEGAKGKVSGGVSFSDERTFGARPMRTKHYNIRVGFFTPQGFTDRTYGLKNIDLVQKYLELIDQATNDNITVLGNVALERVEMPDEPGLIPDMQAYGGAWLFVFKDRK